MEWREWGRDVGKRGEDADGGRVSIGPHILVWRSISCHEIHKFNLALQFLKF